MCSWQRHPNEIIFWRAFAELMWGLRFSVFVYVKNQAACPYASCLTQFFFISGECWSFILSLDLYYSLRNPFTSVKKNKRLYHGIAWGFGLWTALVVLFAKYEGNHIYGYSKPSSTSIDMFPVVCWLSETNIFPYILNTSWTSCFYIASVTIWIFARLRIKKGLSYVLTNKTKTIENTSAVIMWYIIYWTVENVTVYVNYTVHDGNLL